MRITLKKDSALSNERATMLWLLAVAAFAFALSVWAELDAGQAPHADYFGSVALGISGSALVSFLVLLFPYLHRKRGEAEAVKAKFEAIYMGYGELYRYIESGQKSYDSANEMGYLYYENALLQKAERLERLIIEAHLALEGADIASSELSAADCTFFEKLLVNLAAVRQFCVTVASMWTGGDLRENDFSHVGRKFPSLARAMGDCYRYLLERVDEGCPREELDAVMAAVMKNFSRSRMEAEAALGNLQDVAELLEKNERNLSALDVITAVNRIWRQHAEARAEEFDAAFARLLELQRVDDARAYEAEIDQIRAAIADDRMDDANQRLDELTELMKRKVPSP